MAAISGIEASGAPPHTPPREQKGARAAVDFGGAVTHSEMVSEKLRVDPAALAHKKMASRALRSDDEPQRPSQREQRFAEQDARYDADVGENGKIVDIEA